MVSLLVLGIAMAGPRAEDGRSTGDPRVSTNDKVALRDYVVASPNLHLHAALLGGGQVPSVAGWQGTVLVNRLDGDDRSFALTGRFARTVDSLVASRWRDSAITKLWAEDSATRESHALLRKRLGESGADWDLCLVDCDDSRKLVVAAASRWTECVYDTRFVVMDAARQRIIAERAFACCLGALDFSGLMPSGERIGYWIRREESSGRLRPSALLMLAADGNWEEIADLTPDGIAASPTHGDVLTATVRDTNTVQVSRHTPHLDRIRWTHNVRVDKPIAALVRPLWSDDGRIACVFVAEEGGGAASLLTFDAGSGRELARRDGLDSGFLWNSSVFRRKSDPSFLLRSFGLVTPLPTSRPHKE